MLVKNYVYSFLKFFDSDKDFFTPLNLSLIN